MAAMPDSPAGTPGDVRRKPDSTEIAYKTGLSEPGREWFMMTTNRGGWYTSGVREGVGEWPLMA